VAARGPKRWKARARPGRRWLAVAALAFVGFLYVQPLGTYLETRQTLTRRSAEVRSLAAERRELERRLASQTGRAALVREARRLALVKPGERLYIVKGIGAWRLAHEARVTSRVGGDG
jgi:cell division protein FtsB